MTKEQSLQIGKKQADKRLIDNWERIKAKQHVDKKDSANGN